MGLIFRRSSDRCCPRPGRKGDDATIIRDTKPDLKEAKELKVRIPAHHHMRLHAMRVLTGKPISAAMVEALDAYFERQAR